MKKIWGRQTLVFGAIVTALLLVSSASGYILAVKKVGVETLDNEDVLNKNGRSTTDVNIGIGAIFTKNTHGTFQAKIVGLFPTWNFIGSKFAWYITLKEGSLEYNGKQISSGRITINGNTYHAEEYNKVYVDYFIGRGHCLGLSSNKDVIFAIWGIGLNIRVYNE